MSLSVDAIRREIGERRDLLARLERSIDGYRATAEKFERDLAQAKAAQAAHEAKAAHEARSIEALQAAVAVLTERLPNEPAVPVAPEPVLPKPEPVLEPEPGPVADSTRPRLPQPTPAPRALGAPHQGLRDPLHVNPKQRGSTRTRYTRAPAQDVYQRASELDMTKVTQAQFDRADLLFMLIEDKAGPQFELAARLSGIMGCTAHTASSIVSRALPLLVRQNRITSEGETDGGGSGSKGLVWRVAPPQAASASLGVDDENYGGTTTRWPTDGTAPAKGTRIQVDSGPFEQGKRR